MMLHTLFVLAALALPVQEAAPHPFEFSFVPEHIVCVELNGAAPVEWLAVQNDKIQLLSKTGEFTSLETTLPGNSGLWTIGDLGDGPVFLYVQDGESLFQLSWSQGDGFVWGDSLAEGFSKLSKIPRGFRYADFVQDLDEDGFADLILPSREGVSLSFGGPDGFAPPLIMDSTAEVGLTVGGAQGGLLGEVNRTYRMPPLRMRDLNGDGLADLQLSRRGQIRQYIAAEDGRLPSKASVIDLTRFENSLGDLSFDASNLSSLAQFQVQEHWDDLNQDGASDLLLLVGRRIAVFLGGPNGVDMTRQVDQFSLRGNVVYAFTALIDEDEFPDLCYLKVEDISLGQALSWIIMPVKIDFDLHAYRGRGTGRMEKSPFLSKRIRLNGSSLAGMLDKRDELRAVRRTLVRPADLDGDGNALDIVLLDGEGDFSVFPDLLNGIDLDTDYNQQFLSNILAADGDAQIDEDVLVHWAFGQVSTLLTLTKGVEPLLTIPSAQGATKDQALMVKDMDGDGRDDILVLKRHISEEDESDYLRGFVWALPGD